MNSNDPARRILSERIHRGQGGDTIRESRFTRADFLDEVNGATETCGSLPKRLGNFLTQRRQGAKQKSETQSHREHEGIDFTPCSL